MGHVNNQPSRRSESGPWRGALLALCVVLPLWLQGCGGGGGSETAAATQTPGAATIDSAGGTVTESSGASVVVPANAFAVATTVRIAKDSTGAPALPAGLVAAGNTYVLTPHGGNFAVAVGVRIPAPGATLQPNQELKLAKAQPGGEWAVLQNSVLTNGVLSANVDSFSYFMPVVVSYLLPFVDIPPLQVSASLSCGEQPCGAVTGKVTATYTITTNSGQLPADCTNGSLRIQDGYDRNFGDSYGIETIIPLSGGSRAISLDETTVSFPFYEFVVGLMCNGHRRDLNAPRNTVHWATNYPRKIPQILVEPRDLLVTAGQTASLIVQADGVPAPSMIWQSRPANSTGAWTDVSNGTAATTGNYLTSVTSNYTTPVLTLADNGKQYLVKAVNSRGFVVSTIVTVSVSDVAIAPRITTQPASLNVSSGNDAAFATAASGTDAMSYQWRFNGVAINGANSPVLLLTAVTNGSAGAYSVDVSNGAGTVTSNAATLTISSGAPAMVAPSIVTQPVPATANVGNTATFAVGVSGTGPFTYQWLKGGQPISGATAAFYSIASAALADAGSYGVRVTNSVNSVTSSSATLTINANPVISAVAITSQPSPQIQLPGGSATFAVAASGTGPLSYHWLKDGSPITGATDAVLLLSNLQVGDVAAYSVTVSNSLGGVTSSAASLTVVGAPAITTQPANASASEGSTATFSVSATGTNLRYQWTLNGVGIGGATSASYTTPTLAMSDNGAVYGVMVYNGTGLIYSQSALLTVVAVPVPVPVATPLLATAVAAGFGSSYAVGTDGSLWAWGFLVDPITGGYKASTPYASAPVHVLGLTGVQRVVVVSETGNVYALHTDGTVSAWGRNDVGQLGDRTTTTRTLPVKVLEGGATANPAPITGICQIAAGNAALAMAPCDNSPVQMVGLMSITNFGGATGSGLTPNGGVATAVPGLPSVRVRAMAMPDAAANTQGGLLVSYIDARVFAWGAQTNNSLGAGASATLAGTAVSALDVTATFGPLGFQVNKIDMGRDFTLVGWAGGAVKGIGRNVEGQLGNGTTTTRTTLGDVGGIVTPTEFSVGQVNAAALVGGNVYIWGWQNGSIMSSPTQLTTGGGYAQLSMGDQHGLLIDIGGQVHAWGDGSFGALGTGALLANLPVLVMRP